MTTTTTHYEYETEPFTDHERNAIATYESGLKDGYNADMLKDLLDSAEYLAQRTYEQAKAEDQATPDDPNKAVEIDRAHILAHFDWLSQWYGRLDSLKSDLSNCGEGPRHSVAARRYLEGQCREWFHTLNLVRREACRWAFGTAGPQPEVSAGYVTFFDIPGIELDGTIAAENQ